MVIVVILLTTNVFLWTLSQNTLYNEAVKEKNQLEVDRLNERIKAFDATYTAASDKVSVSAQLQNQGPLSVQITNLWVRNIDKNLYNFSGTLNVNLQPGGNSTLTIDVTVIGSAPGDRFSSWLITGRGNVVPLQEREQEEIIVAQVAYGIGAVSMNFTDFKYYNVTKKGSSWVLNNYPNGIDGYTVIQPSGKDVGIAFQVYFTNFDIEKREIKLSSTSVLWTLFPVLPTQPRGAMWYIVNVNGDGTIASTFTTVTLQYAVPTPVFFASSNDVKVGGFSPSLSSYTGTAPVNLALVGTIGGSPFGQNIPFVSIYVK